MPGGLNCKYYVDWEWHRDKCIINQTEIFIPLMGKNIINVTSHEACENKNHDGHCKDFKKVSLFSRIINHLFYWG